MVIWRPVALRLRKANDPTVARILWALIFAALVAGALTIPTDWSINDLLPLFGGAIVLLGSYFAARTLLDNEITQATQLLASPCSAVRVAGIYRLGKVADAAPHYRGYVRATLSAYISQDSGDEVGTRRARAVLADLGLTEGALDDISGNQPTAPSAA
jgi:hypothetical protein